MISKISIAVGMICILILILIVSKKEPEVQNQDPFDSDDDAKDYDNLKDIPVKFVRLERTKTNTWITCALPHAMNFSDAMDYAEAQFPGFESVSCSQTNPDNYVQKP